MSKKVVVAMSGGVDSSVAAALLREQGYDVVGVTMRLSNWEETEGRKFGGCCGSKDFYDARTVAQALDIPHYAFDYVEHFRQSVIGYFKDSYLAGETPNPCIACNQHVKFDRLLEQVTALGADYLATGHYARIEKSFESQVSSFKDGTLNLKPETCNYLLKKAADPRKDQSYVLYGLGQEELSRLMFPLADYTKDQIREMARKYNLRTADKPDSQEICFVPNNDYRLFLEEQIPASQRPAGPIRYKDGTVLGEHRGLLYYTIGQREGLGLSQGRPLYVMTIDTQTNTLVVGEKDDVFSEAMVIRNVSWVSGHAPEFPCKVSVKIRYKHREAKARIESAMGRMGDGASEQDSTHAVSPARPLAGSPLRVIFDEPQSAITPGQAAVFYDGDIVLGGGVIHQVLHKKREQVTGNRLQGREESNAFL